MKEVAALVLPISNSLTVFVVRSVPALLRDRQRVMLRWQVMLAADGPPTARMRPFVDRAFWEALPALARAGPAAFLDAVEHGCRDRDGRPPSASAAVAALSALGEAMLPLVWETVAPGDERVLAISAWQRLLGQACARAVDALRELEPRREWALAAGRAGDWEAIARFDEGLLETRTVTEVLEAAAHGLRSALGMGRCAFFVFSPASGLVVGLHAVGFPMEEVTVIGEPLAHLRPFQRAAGRKTAVWEADVSLLDAMPRWYTQRLRIRSLVVTPLLAHGRLLGFAALDRHGAIFRPAAGDLERAGRLGERVALALYRFLRHHVEEIGRDGAAVEGSRAPEAGQNGRASAPRPAAVVDASRPTLSARELQVLRQAADGLSIKEIAQRLALSEFTVRDYLESCIAKTGARNRAHAVALAIRLGLM